MGSFASFFEYLSFYRPKVAANNFTTLRFLCLLVAFYSFHALLSQEQLCRTKIELFCAVLTANVGKNVANSIKLENNAKKSSWPDFPQVCCLYDICLSFIKVSFNCLNQSTPLAKPPKETLQTSNSIKLPLNVSTFTNIPK